MAQSKASLTKAQERMLHSVADEAVTRHFDVYGGYWWTERGKRLPAYGKSEKFPPLPIRYLLAGKLIAEGVNTRPHSGYHELPYVITEAGRAHLNTKKGLRG